MKKKKKKAGCGGGGGGSSESFGHLLLPNCRHHFLLSSPLCLPLIFAACSHGRGKYETARPRVAGTWISAAAAAGPLSCERTLVGGFCLVLFPFPLRKSAQTHSYGRR